MLFGRNRYELVPHAEIERQRIVDLPVILKVVADEQLPELRGCTGIECEPHEPVRPRLQQRCEIGELILRLAGLRFVIVIDAFQVETQLHRVRATLNIQVVRVLVNILRELLRRRVQMADIGKCGDC